MLEVIVQANSIWLLYNFPDNESILLDIYIDFLSCCQYKYGNQQIVLVQYWHAVFWKLFFRQYFLLTVVFGNIMIHILTLTNHEIVFVSFPFLIVRYQIPIWTYIYIYLVVSVFSPTADVSYHLFVYYCIK